MRRQFAILCATILAILPMALAPVRAASSVNAGSVGGLPSGSYSLGNRQDGEIVSKRTRTSRTFAENGHYVTTVYQNSVNYQDAQGTWQPIDDTLTSATRSGYAYQNKANRYTVNFPSDLGSAPIHVEVGGSSLDFSLVGASGTGSVSGNTDTFTIPGATIAFTAENDLLKENITLSGPTSPSTFVYSVAMSAGLTARQNADGSIDFLDGSGQSKFSFAAPIVYDHSGPSSATSSAVSMKLTQGASGVTVSISVDPTWLADSSRTWPVTIDPTVNFNPTLSCRMRSNAYANVNACGYVEVGYRSSYPFAARSLLQFDLSSLPGDAQVLNAELGLYAYTVSGTATPPNIPVNVYQVTRSWTSGVTWNKYDGTNAWTTAGGDFNATAAATNNAVGSPYGWYHWYPTQLVQGWLNGTIPNDGMLLKEPTETKDTQVDFYPTGTDLPYLKISYQSRIGAQSFYTMPQRQLTDHMDLSVNVANGNAILNESDLNMDGIGLPLSVGRAYNNQSTGMGDLGNGWAMSTGRDIGLGFFPDGSATFYGPSGYQTPFIKNADGSFTSPTGADSTLVQNGDGTYTMTFHASGEQYNFSSGGYFLSDVDQSGNKLSFGYDGSNRLISITDTQGRLTSFQYSTSNLITQMTDPASRTYGYGYDSSNNLVSYTDPAGKVTQFVYDVNHNLTQITDPVGNVTKLVYDVNSRVSSVTYVTNPSTGAGYTTSFAYNSGNTVVTDPNGHASTYYFDTTDRVTSTKDPLAYVKQLVWTADSKISQTKLPSGATTTTSFDSSNNATQITLPTNSTTTAQYGNASLPYSPTSFTDTSGTTATIQYNSQGLPTSATDAENHTVSVAYNSNGTVASLTDKNGSVTSYSYYTSGTSVGLSSQITPPSPLGSYTYTYNSYNLVASQTDGKGQLTTYGYDSMGRLTSVGYADGTAIGYSYDGDGNALAMTDSHGTTTYSYDALNELTQETPPTGGSTSYSYDADGNVLSKTDSGGTTSYTYTADGQVAAVTDRGGAKSTLTYDSDGQLTQIAYPNGVTQSRTYDGAGELTKIIGAIGGTTLTSFSYSYTNPSNNQPTTVPYSVTDVANRTTSYSYDLAGELTQAVQKSGGTTIASYSYTHDAAGNTTSQTLNGATTTFTYNAASQLTQASGSINATYSYDANGNLTTLGNLALQYNSAGQTTSITPSGGSAINMAYSGEGQSQRIGAGGNTYQYDSAGIKMEATSSGNTYFTTLPDGTGISETITSGPNSGTYYYLSDGMGSVTGLTNSSGGLVDQYAYDPNGNLTSSSVTVPNPYTYLGWEYDSTTGVYHTGNGYYDPTTGQATCTKDLGRADTLSKEDWCGEDEPPYDDQWRYVLLVRQYSGKCGCQAYTGTRIVFVVTYGYMGTINFSMTVYAPRGDNLLQVSEHLTLTNFNTGHAYVCLHRERSHNVGIGANSFTQRCTLNPGRGTIFVSWTEFYVDYYVRGQTFFRTDDIVNPAISFFNP